MIGFYDCEDSFVYLTGAYLELGLIFRKEDLFENSLRLKSVKYFRKKASP